VPPAANLIQGKDAVTIIQLGDKTNTEEYDLQWLFLPEFLDRERRWAKPKSKFSVIEHKDSSEQFITRVEV